MSSQPTLSTYVSDMIALEQHMTKPLESQIADSTVQALPKAHALISEILATGNSHIAALNAALQALGGHDGSPLKSGVAAAVGAVASAIDNVRKTELSKDLRDDYTAMCLATASYTMLNATALGFKNQAVAELAKRHLSEYGSLIMKASALLPSAVLKELSDLGVAVDPSVQEQARADEEKAWQKASANS